MNNTIPNVSTESIFNMMMKMNPQFAKFVNDTKGMTIQQIADKYKIDLNAINQFQK